MTAPETDVESEPTLVEAFGELSEALASETDGEQPEEQAPEEETAPEAEAEGDRETPSAQPATPDQQQQTQQKEPTQQPGQPEQSAQAEQPPDVQPLTYTIAGQARTFDGGFVVPGLGAVVTADALPRLQDRLQQADRLVAQNRGLYAQTQEYQRLGGLEKFNKLTESNAMLDASAALLLRALSDEATLVTLATDPVARQQLIREIQLTAREAQMKASTTLRETQQKEAQQQQAAGQTQTALHNAVGYLAQQFEGLTAEDVQTVRSHAARMHAALVRPATPDEAREANVQVGAPIIDMSILHSLLADRHQLRQSALQSAARHQANTQENRARVAAAAPTTVVQNGKAAPRPGAGKAPAKPAPKGLDAMSSAEITRAMKSGKIFDLIGEDDE